MEPPSLSDNQNIDNLPNPTLPHIIGEPTHEQLIQMHKKL